MWLSTLSGLSSISHHFGFLFTPKVYFIRYKTPGSEGGGPGGPSPVLSGYSGAGGIDYSSGGGDIGSNTIGTDYGAPAGQEYGSPSY